ncbi:hypothetical protein ABTJ92_20380, partial [Acinetobacter baumannii]
MAVPAGGATAVPLHVTATDDDDPAVRTIEQQLDAAQTQAAAASSRALAASAAAERARELAATTAARADALTAQSTAAESAL